MENGAIEMFLLGLKFGVPSLYVKTKNNFQKH